MSTRRRLTAPARLPDAEAEASWSSLLEGDFILVFFPGDDVWHEMLVVGKVSGRIVCAYTLDEDMYLIGLDGRHRSVTSCLAWRVVDRGGELPMGLEHGVYRFDSCPGRGKLAHLIQEGAAVCREYCRSSRETVVEDRLVVNENGVEEVRADFLGSGSGRRRRRTEGESVARPDVASAAPVGGGGSARPTVRRADEGEVWVSAEPIGGLALGEEVRPGGDAVMLDDRVCVVPRGDLWVKCELLRVDDVPAYVGARRELFVPRDLLGAPSVEGAARRADRRERPDEDRGDIRTLPVDFDAHNERHKDWREVCREIYFVAQHDWPVEGPDTVVHFCKHTERQAKSPTAWLEKWCRNKHVQESDRVYHELKTYCEILERAGSYDQLNVASLASMELLCRRVQTIIDAYDINPNKPCYDSARYYSGLATAADGVSPELRAYVARRARDDAEVEKQRQKARELRGQTPAGAPKGGAPAK